ncbi:MAG: twin-arginine translocation signal domain-containing protein [Candidatus Omnitrophica bacterium]|nr:twin-arginine translocation signal domain-containing protein [Candidatus Omnitrophota bacterium]
MTKISRRQFLKLAGLGSLAMFFIHIFSRMGLAEFGKQKYNGRLKKKIITDHDLVAVKGEDPAAITKKAIEA